MPPSTLRGQRGLSLALIGWATFITAWMLGSSDIFRATPASDPIVGKVRDGSMRLSRRIPEDGSQHTDDQPGDTTKWVDKAEPEANASVGDGGCEVYQQSTCHCNANPACEWKFDKKGRCERWKDPWLLNTTSVADKDETDPWMKKDQKTWKLMILFQHNLPILQQAIDGYRRGSDIMASNMVIIDNSNTQEAYSDAGIHQTVGKIIVTPRTLNFPELHNFMADTAIGMNLEFFFWAHADNYVLPMSPGRDLGKDVLRCMRRKIDHKPDWGMMLFAYDHLAVFRTQTMVQVPWDPLVFQYGSECDAYGRIKTAGYTTDVCKVHRSWDMKMVMNITDDMPYDVVKEILDADWKIKNGRNNWREKEIDPEEQEWRTAMKMESREYLMEKWKKKGCNLGPTKDKVTHKLVPTPCHKPWPYCPNCPTHLPDCLSHTMSKNDLKHIQAEKKKAFKGNPKQPIPLADFKKRKQGKA